MNAVPTKDPLCPAQTNRELPFCGSRVHNPRMTLSANEGEYAGCKPSSRYANEQKDIGRHKESLDSFAICHRYF